MKNSVWIALCLFFTACSKKDHVSVEPVYPNAVVEDPEIKIIEKTFPPDFTGFVPKYYNYDTSHIDYLLEVKNGELKARYFFDRDRHLEEENHYDCRSMHGLQKRYYINGKVKESLEMDHGVRHGYHIKYSPSGKIRASERWKSGEPAGPIRVYDSAGNFSHYANRNQYDSLFLD